TRSALQSPFFTGRVRRLRRDAAIVRQQRSARVRKRNEATAAAVVVGFDAPPARICISGDGVVLILRTVVVKPERATANHGWQRWIGDQRDAMPVSGRIHTLVRLWRWTDDVEAQEAADCRIAGRATDCLCYCKHRTRQLSVHHLLQIDEIDTRVGLVP